MRTIEDLKELRKKLERRRMVEVFRLQLYSDDIITSVANIQTAIAALDAVIEEGGLPSDSEDSYFKSLEN